MFEILRLIPLYFYHMAGSLTFLAELARVPRVTGAPEAPAGQTDTAAVVSASRRLYQHRRVSVRHRTAVHDCNKESKVCYLLIYFPIDLSLNI